MSNKSTITFCKNIEMLLRTEEQNLTISFYAIQGSKRNVASTETFLSVTSLTYESRIGR